MLTSYDAMTASIFEAAGAKALLVGDTAGMVVFGREDTVSVTIDELLPLAKAVVTGSKTALVVGDLPFGSYEASSQIAVESAIRYLKEAGVHAVKLEGGRRSLPAIAAIANSNIPVMGHLGLTPQTANALGGMQRVQGRGIEGDVLLEDALALEEAGAFAVVLEAVPASLAARVSEKLEIPTIGIGAGPDCDAQVMVWQDLVGLTPGRVPRFVKPYADVRSVVAEAVSNFVTDVSSGAYPDEEHSYS